MIRKKEKRTEKEQMGKREAYIADFGTIVTHNVVLRFGV